MSTSTLRFEPQMKISATDVMKVNSRVGVGGVGAQGNPLKHNSKFVQLLSNIRQRTTSRVYIRFTQAGSHAPAASFGLQAGHTSRRGGSWTTSSSTEQVHRLQRTI